MRQLGEVVVRHRDGLDILCLSSNPVTKTGGASGADKTHGSRAFSFFPNCAPTRSRRAGRFLSPCQGPTITNVRAQEDGFTVSNQQISLPCRRTSGSIIATPVEPDVRAWILACRRVSDAFNADAVRRADWCDTRSN